jgi:hypothetical protein
MDTGDSTQFPWFRLSSLSFLAGGDFHAKDAHTQSLAHRHPTVICFLVFTVFASLLVPFHPHLADAIVGSIVPKFPW